jgi:hypothetical protein
VWARRALDGSFRRRSARAGGDDESGLFMKYLRRGSGYYIDVGALIGLIIRVCMVIF